MAKKETAMGTLKKIFILHGWATHKQTDQKWQPIVDSLKGEGYSAKVLKIPGLSAPLNEVWNLDNFVEWLHTEIKDEKSFILVGHSFGGQIASRFTARYPEQVETLVLIDSSGIRDNTPKARVKRGVFMVLAKIGKIFFQNENLRKLLYKAAREQDYKNAPPLLRRTMSTILDDEVLTDLPNIHTRTIIIWGEQDTVTPLWMGKIFEKEITNSTLYIIPEARHSPQFTHPKEVVKIIHTQ